ncbi:MAG: penicillin-binding protein 2 [Gaiellaceae bacterium]
MQLPTRGPFLPGDPRVERPFRLTRGLGLRIAVFGGLAVVLFGVLLFRLWALQVVSGDEYLAAAQENQVRTARVDGQRGTVVDVRGKAIVENTPGTIVQLWPADVPPEEVDVVVGRLSDLLDVSAQDIYRQIDRLDGDPLTPIVVKRFVKAPKPDFILEHQADFPGVVVADTEIRDYPLGRLAAHMVGYVGEISTEELEDRDSDEYGLGDSVGKTGIERSYDRFLRGTPGLDEVRFNALGQQVRQRSLSIAATAGNRIRLTIDSDLQAAAERALREGVVNARTLDDDAWAAAGGAVVALDPRNGAIRAIASYPDFDPSIWSGTREENKIARLGDTVTNLPGLNRALSGLYPPGSVFKPVTALAALSELNATSSAPILETEELIPCTSEIEVADRIFKNWQDRDEALTLPFALAESCDTFFYDLGLRFYNLPEDRGSPLQFWARRMGFGERTGVDIGPESEGLLPTPDWRRQHYRTAVAKLWKPGNSVTLAIGQDDLLVTPLQMTRMYALLANGGKLVQPHMVAQVEQTGSDLDDPIVLRRFSPAPPREIGLDANHVRVVQQGLFDATHAEYGTSSSTFGNYPVPIAGKTGTAEKYQRLPKGYLESDHVVEGLFDQAWWCGYGPAAIEDEPTLAVCVLVENGGLGGQAAAPIALEVFAEHFGQEIPVDDVAIGNVVGQTD